MQFYKIYAKMNVNEGGETSATRDLARELCQKTSSFNISDKKNYCFVSSINDDSVSIGIITTHLTNLKDFAKSFADSIGIPLNITDTQEITFGCMQSLLISADRHSYIDDDYDVLKLFGLDNLAKRHGLEFGENIINSISNEDGLISFAKKHFMNDTLIPELNRIKKGAKSTLAKGHPVHYILETDDKDTRREAYRVILEALFHHNRLASSRYAFLDFRPDEDYSRSAFESLYKISEGGAVVIRYLANEKSSDRGSSLDENDIIENICTMAKSYRNKVLTIICFPRECTSIKKKFYESLGTMTFIEIREDFISAPKAKKYLTSLAKEQGVRANGKLFSCLNNSQSFLVPELDRIFDEWYNKSLKSSVYPQYKDITEVRKATLEAKPQGNAYDELMEMIGLTEAKAVIKKSLNYYKMQKIYEERGVKRDNPAMHMIFTGNPGTAKTTVARLFARIMCENNFLTKGHIVEVGRGDIVGKFVGWTANIVKEKFREASGGVLFIDEAYSLVDDRNGSFGDEAINTIVQEMENHRKDTIVIFAGYPDKMEQFMEKNPGLRSRIAFHIPFADYTSHELCQITELLCKKNGMKIEKEALKILEKSFDVARCSIDFGNGRYARNIFEQSKMNQASRLLEKDFDSLTDEDIITLTACDIVVPEENTVTPRRIGF